MRNLVLRKIFCSILCLSLGLRSVAVYAQTNIDQNEQDAEVIVQQKIATLEMKTKMARDTHCLPPENISDQTKWFEENPLSPECFKAVLELEELYRNLESEHHEAAQAVLEHEGEVCESNQSTELGIDGANLSDLESAAEKSACSEERKQEISRTCADGFLCVIGSTAASTILTPGLGTLLANAVMPASFKAQGCNAQKDDCNTQLVLGFAKSVWGLLEGVWDLLKMAGKGIANKASSFWDWVTNAEKNTSTAQLTLAQASEDEGIFQMLVNDFTGTMSKIWSALLGAIKEWLSSNVFCQEWEGVPQFSQCKRPALSAECLECKAMLTGLCVIGGTILAEVVPAFLTGGIATAAKYGVAGAAKLAKLIKVSSVALKIIKEAPLVLKIMRPVNKVVKTLRLVEIATVSLNVLRKTVSLVATHLVSPAVRVLKTSFSVMHLLATRAKTYVMLTRAGPVITFGLKSAKLAGKVIIFPFDNAMLTKSFEFGEKTFEKIFSKMAQAKMFGGIRPLLAGEAARLMGKIEDAGIELQVTRFLSKSNAEKIAQVEQKYVKAIQANRHAIVGDLLKARPKWNLSKLIEELYPELQYAKKFPPSEIRKAELELFDALLKMGDEAEKTRLISEYQRWVASKARAQAVGKIPSFTQNQVLAHASLSSAEANQQAFLLVNVATSPKLEQGLSDARALAQSGVYHESAAVIGAQYKILTEAGFLPSDAELLVRSGYVGKLAQADSFENLRSVVLPTRDVASVSQKFSKILGEVEEAYRPSLGQLLKVLEDSGLNADEISKVWNEYREIFKGLMKKAGPDSDATALLAHYVGEQKKLGVADKVIKKEIEKVLGACP